MTNTTYLAAAVLCIGAIGALSDQKTARIGNTLGLLGVSTGIVATLGGIGGTPELYAQIGGKTLAPPGLIFVVLHSLCEGLPMLGPVQNVDSNSDNSSLQERQIVGSWLNATVVLVLPLPFCLWQPFEGCRATQAVVAVYLE